MSQTKEEVMIETLQQALHSLQQAILAMKLLQGSERPLQPVNAGKKRPENTARPGTKAHEIGNRILSPGGISAKEGMKLTGWTAISIPQQAALCGLDKYLRSEKVGKEKRYFVSS